ncbi:MAG: dipeptide epimerase [Granulosicoccus sp.]|nr:dipeptide epimerase [Granulosicoccus sp.]
MQTRFQTIRLPKRFPLAISRGVNKASDNLFLWLTMGGVTGLGEMSPGKTEGANTPELAQQAIQQFLDTQGDLFNPYEASREFVERVYDTARNESMPACALAALDIALWDWLGKSLEKSVHQYLDIGKPHVPTSVTIGINPPEVVKERVPLLLNGTGVKSLKIKLGSPEGVDADKAMYQQVVESTKPYDVQLRVDANGGWSVKQAEEMMVWIAERGADYIEQPLKEGNEDGLAVLFPNRALPIYIDESCRFSSDVEKWADRVDGVNMKLMKCGGITEALRIIEAARSHELKTMIGCMGESSVSIAAAAQITGWIDHIDLDSHLNLAPDPSLGAEMQDGIIVPNDLPGHGASVKPEFIET